MRLAAGGFQHDTATLAAHQSLNRYGESRYATATYLKMVQVL
jgi:hypothetical protein